MALIAGIFKIITNSNVKRILFTLLFFIICCCKTDSKIDHHYKMVFDKHKLEILKNEQNDLKSGDIKVYLKGAPVSNPVLGNTISTDTSFIFNPIIPFSVKQEYHIYAKSTHIKTFVIEEDENVNNNKTRATIYPTKDTLPENLLKIYIEFSSPMQEVGNSLNYITVTNETNDSLVDIFLELESELWNKEHTFLTLWLDPGRIKTDLLPNQILGLPIREGNKYSIKVDPEWKDVYGNHVSSYRKYFYVTEKDQISPDFKDWDLIFPKSNTRDTLTIDFKESIDAVLAKEFIIIEDNEGAKLPGDIYLQSKESIYNFIPDVKWKSGNYSIYIDAKLEDLAGNNINRLFDTDTEKRIGKKEDTFYRMHFKIE